MKKLVSFSGSGGGGSSSPTIEADSLRSTDYVELILGLCQGPIKGLVNSQQSFYIGSTPFIGADGTPNFPSLSLVQTAGETPGDKIYPVLGGLQNTRSLVPNCPLTTGNIITMVTSSDACSELILGFFIDTLYQTATIAQLGGVPGANSVTAQLPGTLMLAINVQNASGTWLNPFPNGMPLTARTLTGVPTEVTVPVSGPGPYTIAVQMLTPQSSSTATQAFIHWVNWTEVQAGATGWSRTDTVQQQLFPTNSFNSQGVSNTAVVRTTQQAPQRPDGTFGIDFLSVRIAINELVLQKTNGDTLECGVNFRIEYKPTSSTVWTKLYGKDINVFGKTTTSVDIQQWTWPVSPPLVDDTWDIRVAQITYPGLNETINTSWESIEELIGGPMQFDGVATVHVWGKGTQTLTSIPNLWGIYDLKMMKLPGNYNPFTRAYTGTFDGTTPQFDWSNNPAWCVYDLATNQSYGWASYFSDFSIDIYDIYAAGHWCDVMVPDGAGGLQPRYTMNLVISEPRGAREQLRYMAGTFDGLLIDDLSGTLRLVYDDPNDPPVAIFTPENTIDDGGGSFQYTYTDTTTRYNYVTVSFNDPAINYQVNTRVVYDSDNIAEFGKVPLDFAAVGCTNPHEAVRRAARKLISATTEKEIVSFKTNRTGLAVTPLKNILVADPDMGYGLTGRIKALDPSRTIAYLRDPLYLNVGVNYIFNCHAPNPNYPSADGTAEPLIVVSIPFQVPDNGGNLVIALSSPLPSTVDPRTNFSVSSEGNPIGVPKPYKVMRIEEQNGNPDVLMFECVEINPAKQDLADNAIDRNGLSFINMGQFLLPPSNVQVNTGIWNSGTQSYANMEISWVPSPDPRVTRYNVQYRVSGTTDWSTTNTTNTVCRCDVFSIPNGTYDVQVQAVGIGGITSTYVTLYGASAGLDTPPGDVTNFNITFNAPTHLTLTWTGVADRNLAYYLIRYSPFMDGTATWENSNNVVEQILTTSVVINALPGTYFIKAINTSGVASLDAATASTVGTGLNPFVCEAVQQAPSWPGLAYCQSDADGYGYVDNAKKLRIGTNGSRQNQAGHLLYYWVSKDYGAPITVNITLKWNHGVDNISETINDWDNLIAVTDLNAATISDGWVGANIVESQDGINFSQLTPPNFTDGNSNGGFLNGTYTGRKFVFAIYLQKNNGNVDPWISDVEFVVTTTAKTASGSANVAPVGGITVPFTSPFVNTPGLSITIKNGASGDFYTFSNESNLEFTIQFFDATGTAVSRTFDWTAIGY